MFTALVRVTGAGRLADFRERLRWLMVRDEDAEEYSEHHADGVLEYRFTLRRGIPFPAIAAASLEFPELQVEAEWDHDGVRGRATIENGQLVQHSPQLTGESELHVEVTPDARLVLGFACSAHDGVLAGYAASAERHTYFASAAARWNSSRPRTPTRSSRRSRSLSSRSGSGTTKKRRCSNARATRATVIRCAVPTCVPTSSGWCASTGCAFLPWVPRLGVHAMRWSRNG